VANVTFAEEGSYTFGNFLAESENAELKGKKFSLTALRYLFYRCLLLPRSQPAYSQFLLHAIINTPSEMRRYSVKT
jgi:hypothetical protein